MTSKPNSINDIVSSYWDMRSQGYAIQVDRQEETEEFSKYRAYFNDLPVGACVLDVGCGPGFFATELARDGFCVTAVDMSQGMLEQAKLRADAKAVHVEVLRADAQKLPFAEATFDLVCCRDLVWNLPDPQASYREWLRILKPGAKLVIFDGNYYRHLFDERYAKVHKAWEESSGHVLLGVETQTIDCLAKSLPLGREDRPDWDVRIFQNIGVKNVQAHTLSAYKGASFKEDLVAKFVVIVQKNL